MRVPFRLFDDLIAVEWLPQEIRREFCRGVLGCPPQTLRLKQRYLALRTAIKADIEEMSRIPRFTSIPMAGARARLPVLQRHAVRALADELGEPLPDVIKEFFLRPSTDTQSALAVSDGVLDLIGRHAEELGPDEVRRLLRKAIKGGPAAVRRTAYRVGSDQFGLAFARPALRDPALLVRDWADKKFSSDRRKRRSSW